MFDNLRILIVNWNLKLDTVECIQSLLQSGACLDQIWIVDNGSGDGSVDFFKKEFGKEINIIPLTENKGFAAGINAGVQRILSENGEWILLINNDTIVSPEFIHELQLAANGPTPYHMIGAAIYYYAYPDLLWYLGDRSIAGSLLSINPYHKKTLPPGIAKLFPVDYLNGCAMLVHVDVFKKIGFFDAGFFMYGEEVDFCLRAKKAHISLACATRAKMWHKISASSRTIRPHMQYLQIRNQIWIYRRYAAGFHAGFLFLFSIFKGLRLGMKALLCHQFEAIRMVMRGWRDGWFSRLDKGIVQ